MPADAAEAVERGGGCFAGGVTRDEVHSLDRHEELCVVGVDEQHELAFHALRRNCLQTFEPPDSVIDVDDKVAGSEIAEVGDERPEFRLSACRFCLAAGFAGGGGVLAEDVLFGKEEELLRRDLETGRERTDTDAARAKVGVILAKHLAQSFGHARRLDYYLRVRAELACERLNVAVKIAGRA